MSTVELGSAFRPKPPDYGPLADLISGLRQSIVDELRRQVFDQMATAVAQAVASIEIPEQQAPIVTVTPQINVDVPGEDDAGEIAATQEQTMVLRQILSELVTLRTLLGQPVTRRVERDSGGMITQMTDSR